MDLLKWEVQLSLDFPLIVTIIGAKMVKTRGSKSE